MEKKFEQYEVDMETMEKVSAGVGVAGGAAYGFCDKEKFWHKV